MKRKRALLIFSSGLTLIELLISLTIFSVVTISLYSTFSSGVSVWRKSDEANRIYQEARLALDQIAREIKSVERYNFGDAYLDQYAFDGTENELSFLIATDSGLKRIKYFLEDPELSSIYSTEVNFLQSMPSSIVAQYESVEERPMALVRKELQGLGVQEEVEGISVLASLVVPSGLSFRYASVSYSDETGTEVEWVSTWQESQSFPMGVKIYLVLVNPRRPEEKIEFVKTVYMPTGNILANE
ncbi:type II secretion system protein J [Candidatus Omnitrophota bacterium]